jgi:hypothetical protein
MQNVSDGALKSVVAVRERLKWVSFQFISIHLSE